MKHVIETDTFITGWANTWTDDDGYPLVFDSKEQAEKGLAGYLRDAQEAFERGDIQHLYLSEDYRISEVTG